MVLNADGQVCFNIQQPALPVGGYQCRGIVSGIAIGKVVGTQVEHTHEGRYEYQRFVGWCYGLVHLAHNVGCTLIVACQIAEEGTSDSHVERCRYALSGNVADDEEEFVAFDDEVIQIAANLLGWGHRGKEIQVVAVRKHRGQHTHLYVVGNDEFTL